VLEAQGYKMENDFWTLWACCMFYYM